MKNTNLKQLCFVGCLLASLILITSDREASPRDFANVLLAAPTVLEQLGKGKEKDQ